MAKEAPKSYLLLKLHSCDDLDSVKFTLDGMTEQKPGIWLHAVLPYDFDLVGMPFLHKLNISINGFERRFAVVAVEPAPEATGVSLKMWKVDVPPSEAPIEKWAIEGRRLFSEMMYGHIITEPPTVRAMRCCAVPGHVMPTGRVFFYEWADSFRWPIAAGECCNTAFSIAR